MVTPELLRVLFQYNLWADRRLMDACAPLTNEQFTRELGSSFGSVSGTLAHLYGAGYIWKWCIRIHALEDSHGHT